MAFVKILESEKFKVQVAIGDHSPPHVHVSTFEPPLDQRPRVSRFELVFKHAGLPSRFKPLYIKYGTARKFAGDEVSVQGGLFEDEERQAIKLLNDNIETITDKMKSIHPEWFQEKEPRKRAKRIIYQSAISADDELHGSRVVDRLTIKTAMNNYNNR